MTFAIASDLLREVSFREGYSELSSHLSDDLAYLLSEGSEDAARSIAYRRLSGIDRSQDSYWALRTGEDFDNYDEGYAHTCYWR